MRVLPVRVSRSPVTDTVFIIIVIVVPSLVEVITEDLRAFRHTGFYKPKKKTQQHGNTALFGGERESKKGEAGGGSEFQFLILFESRCRFSI